MARHDIYMTRSLYFLSHSGRPYPTQDLSDLTGIQLLFPDVSGHGGVCVYSGTFDGPVDLTVETCDARPGALPDDAGWEHVEELVLKSVGTDLRVGALEEPEQEFPTLSLAPDDRYWIRVGARGVHAAGEVPELGLDEEPIEHHLVQVWREA